MKKFNEFVNEHTVYFTDDKFWDDLADICNMMEASLKKVDYIVGLKTKCMKGDEKSINTLDIKLDEFNDDMVLLIKQLKRNKLIK